MCVVIMLQIISVLFMMPIDGYLERKDNNIFNIVSINNRHILNQHIPLLCQKGVQLPVQLCLR